MDPKLEQQILKTQSRLFALELLIIGLWSRFLSEEPDPLAEAHATLDHLKRELEKLTSPSVHPAVSDMVAQMNQEATVALMQKVIGTLQRHRKSR